MASVRSAQIFRRLIRNPGATIGAVIVLVAIVVAVFASVIAPHDPTSQNLRATFRPPSVTYPLGTDSFGRDILSRIIWGSRISLLVGLISVGIAASVGTVVGLLTGYYGGWIDSIGMRLVDVMLAFPGILLAMVIVSILGTSLTNLMIAVGIGAIPGFARLARGSILTVKEQSYVEAARVIGCGDFRIMRVCILPNVAAPLIVYGTLGIASAILSGASLSFLGLGARRPSPEWGVMLADGRDFLRQFWWIATFPGVAIMVVTLAVNMLGDGLRDVLDPRMRRN